MTENTWAAGFTATSGRVAVLVIADNYLDGNTVKHRNHRVEIRINDKAFERVGLSAAESRDLANLLNSAAAQIERVGD